MVHQWIAQAVYGRAQVLGQELVEACRAFKPDEKKILSLIEKGAAVNTLDRFGTCALHHAAGKGMTGVVDALLKAGATVDVYTEQGVTPLGYAVASNRPLVVWMLVEKGAGMRGVDDACVSRCRKKNPELADAVQNLIDSEAQRIVARGVQDTKASVPKFKLPKRDF